MNCYNRNHKSEKDNEAMLSKCSCDIIRLELLFLSNVSIWFSSDKISKISISGYCKFQDLLFGLMQDRSTDHKTNISIYINSENILLSIVEYLSLCFFHKTLDLFSVEFEVWDPWNGWIRGLQCDGGVWWTLRGNV